METNHYAAQCVGEGARFKPVSVEEMCAYLGSILLHFWQCFLIDDNGNGSSYQMHTLVHTILIEEK